MSLHKRQSARKRSKVCPLVFVSLAPFPSIFYQHVRSAMLWAKWARKVTFQIFYILVTVERATPSIPGRHRYERPSLSLCVCVYYLAMVKDFLLSLLIAVCLNRA